MIGFYSFDIERSYLAGCKQWPHVQKTHIKKKQRNAYLPHQYSRNVHSSAMEKMKAKIVIYDKK